MYRWSDAWKDSAVLLILQLMLNTSELVKDLKAWTLILLVGEFITNLFVVKILQMVWIRSKKNQV